MLFPTHLLAAVILGRRSRLSTVWLVGGAALPDVIDKPLGIVGIMNTYQTVGHSLLFLSVLTPLVFSSPLGRAVVAGWGSHLVLDALHMIVNGRPVDTLSLAWPLAESPEPLGLPPGSFVSFYVGSPSFVLESLLWLTAGLFFFRDWRPGPDTDAK
jgi:hypothetical protein